MRNQTEWQSDQWERVQQVMNDSEYDYLPEFQHWLHQNFPLWKAFVDKVREASRFKNRPRFSARAIIEIIRWDTAIRERDITFKVNNNYCADLARLAMARWPDELGGFFNIRGSVNRTDAVE